MLNPDMKEDMAMDSEEIDWQDFVIVEKIELYDD